MSTTITIERLCKHYKPFLGTGPRHAVTKAVDDISLTINAGELYFLLGPSGCGKTTLLRMIAGFVEPTSGRILFDGEDVTRTRPAKRNCGMVFQSYALWPHMTVLQNVEFGLKVRKVPRAERTRRALEALAGVRMEQYARRKPNQLSGGQQQRVALARALVVRPNVLLLDEPLSNLDAKLRLEMRREIRRACKETGTTAVYVTHDQKEALSMADAMAVLDMGVIAQTGTPRQLYERPGSRFVADFLGETNFIEAVVEESGPGHTRLRTAAGEIFSTNIPSDRPPAPGAKITCSIRPEAIRIHTAAPDQRRDAGNGQPPTTQSTLRGRLIETLYLGETAQHTVELPSRGAGPTVVKVFELHPTGAPPRSGDVLLEFSAGDAVVLTR